MLHPVLPHGRWARYGLLFGLWTFIGLIDGIQFYIHLNYFNNHAMPLGEALLSGLADWYGWAFLSPLIVEFWQRLPLTPQRFGRRLSLHLLFALAVVCIKSGMDLGLAMLIHGEKAYWNRPLLEAFQYYVWVKFITFLLVYWLIVGVYHLVTNYEQSRARELATSQLQTQLVQAQLQILKMQLQPHFLFNTLNAISALLHKDPALADRMIARLGELLRTTLDHDGSQEVTVQQELDFIRPYLEIEQARFGPRLRVTVEAAPEVRDALLPSMILQPLVENAIRHGVAVRTGPGTVTIQLWQVGPALQVRISDDGPGLAPQFREGRGLSNTRARLQGLYGPAHELTLANGPTGGAVATLTVPLRGVSPPSDQEPGAGRQELAVRDQVAVLH